MNRRVLAALITLADVHEAKETDSRGLDVAYCRHGHAMSKFRDDEDDELYETIVKALCKAGETIHSDVEAAMFLNRARITALPSTPEAARPKK